MIRTILIFCVFILGLLATTTAQEQSELVEGTITYVTSNSVYVRFSATSHINIDDTLFLQQNERLTPALVVNNKSSMSVVCTSLPGFVFKENDKVISRKVVTEEEIVEQTEAEDTVQKTPVVVAAVKDTAEKEKTKPRQQIGGRFSISSYTNWSNATQDVGQRMRYTFSFSGQNLGGSKFSLETYISFVHQFGRWQEINDNVTTSFPHR